MPAPISSPRLRGRDGEAVGDEPLADRGAALGMARDEDAERVRMALAHEPMRGGDDLLLALVGAGGDPHRAAGDGGLRGGISHAASAASGGTSNLRLPTSRTDGDAQGGVAGGVLRRLGEAEADLREQAAGGAREAAASPGTSGPTGGVDDDQRDVAGGASRPMTFGQSSDSTKMASSGRQCSRKRST